MTYASLNRLGTVVLLLIFLALAVGILASIPHRTDVMAEPQIPQGDPAHGAAAIAQYGCGTCHWIPGIPGADGMAGPALSNLSRRSILAGQLPNNPENLISWIEHPQHIKPGDGMPDLGIGDTDARDIAAYLYSLH